MVAEGSAESGLKVSLHPLPILNVSEHLTRVSLQQRDPNVRVVGALLGIQQGRDIEIMNSFEIVVEPTKGELMVDHGYFITRRDQYKQVFPTFDVLGWYSVGEGPTPEDIALHKQFFEYNETPLFLQLSRSSSSGKDLPVTIYESIVEIVDNNPEVVLIRTPYEIETGEAERVAVDHASKPSDTGTGGVHNGLIANLSTQRNAIKMLHDRIAVIVQYLQAVASGKAVKDEETLRQISSFVTSMPATDSLDFREEFMTEYNDVLLTTYLSTLTKQLSTANELLDKQLFLSSGAPGGGGGGGPGRGGGRRHVKDDFFSR